MNHDAPALTKDQFLKDVAQHAMTVIRDDGLYRHLRFKSPDGYSMYFDLLTYPGGLLYRGDMGTFVFERLADMFEFFRTGGARINPSYWSEKLTAGRSDSVEFSELAFEQQIKEDVLRWVRDNGWRTTREQRRDLWDEVMAQVIDADGDYGGHRKQIAAHEFGHIVKPGLSFSFDLMGHDFTEYTHGFLWCCYALVWGIQQYDLVKASPPAEGCAP
jgi:hypothetical protein